MGPDAQKKSVRQRVAERARKFVINLLGLTSQPRPKRVQARIYPPVDMVPDSAIVPKRVVRPRFSRTKDGGYVTFYSNVDELYSE